MFHQLLTPAPFYERLSQQDLGKLILKISDTLFKDPEFREQFVKEVFEWQKQRDAAVEINFLHQYIRDEIKYALQATIADIDEGGEVSYEDNDASGIINRQSKLIEPEDGGDELIIRVFLQSQHLMDKYSDLLEKMYNDSEKVDKFQLLKALAMVKERQY